MNRNNTVRIFTNGNLAEIKLPKNEYKYCTECKKELGEKMTIIVRINRYPYRFKKRNDLKTGAFLLVLGLKLLSSSASLCVEYDKAT